MGYKALVTLDLPKATSQERDDFYKVLKEEDWSKIPNLNTSWKVSFKDGVSRNNAISTMKNDIAKAKRDSGVKTVYYALQLDTYDVVIEN